MSNELESKGKPSFWERIRHPYRLVIMNHDTFEEIGSYRGTLLNVYLGVAALIMLVALLVIALVFFTPLRRLAPGYGDINETSEWFQMKAEIDSLEGQLVAQQVYIDKFRKMISGDVEPQPAREVSEEQLQQVLDSTQEPAPIPEEDELRRSLRFGQQRINPAGGLATGELASSVAGPEKLYFTPPVSGPISAGFMPERRHFGVDVLAPKNTAIKAAMDGFVTLSDWTLETGHTIAIQHDNNVITFYKHNSALLKKVGDFVKAGEAIAIIGNSGTLSSGPHLHFEIWYDGKPLDPAKYVNF